MFRLTIREFCWVTACTVLAFGWWGASHAEHDVTMDAWVLPEVSTSHTICTVNEASSLLDLQHKQSAQPSVLVTPRIIITGEEE